MVRRRSVFPTYVGTVGLLIGGTGAQLVLAEAFTYQGQLKDAGAPVNGTANLTFKLFDAAAAGNQLGNTLTFIGLAITNGVFTVTLDFGFNNSIYFPGDPRWLEVAVNELVGLAGQMV